MVINALLSFSPYLKMWQKNYTKIQTLLFHLNIYLLISTPFLILWTRFDWWILFGVILYVSIHFTSLKATRYSPTTFIFRFLEFWHGIIARKVILVSLTNYILYHCPLFFIVLKVHPFPLCRSFCTCFHTLYCRHISFPFFNSHRETTVKSLISTSLPIASNNPQYGAHLIYSHIFFSHTLMNWPSKNFPFTELNILFEVIISLRLFSSLDYSYLFSIFIIVC
jgi:hypothetical protein